MAGGTLPTQVPSSIAQEPIDSNQDVGIEEDSSEFISELQEVDDTSYVEDSGFVPQVSSIEMDRQTFIQDIYDEDCNIDYVNINSISIDYRPELKMSSSGGLHGIDKMVNGGKTITQCYEEIKACTSENLSERAHIDGGSQANVTGDRNLLFFQKEVQHGPRLRVADGSIHRCNVVGFTCIPCPTAPDGSGRIFVQTWYKEGFPGTIVSPDRIGKQYNCKKATLQWELGGNNCIVSFTSPDKPAIDIPLRQIGGLLFSEQLI